MLVIGKARRCWQSSGCGDPRRSASLGIPVYLSGMARGLLGRDHPLQMRHARPQRRCARRLRAARRRACDFRLDYGKHVRRSAEADRRQPQPRRRTLNGGRHRRESALRVTLVGRRAVERARAAAEWIAGCASGSGARAGDRRAGGGPRRALQPRSPSSARSNRAAGDERDGRRRRRLRTPRLLHRAAARTAGVARPRRFRKLGGRRRLRAWGAKLRRPESEVWLIWGDGASGYGLPSSTPSSATGAGNRGVGNERLLVADRREQVKLCNDDVGTVWRRSDYTASPRASARRGWW